VKSLELLATLRYVGGMTHAQNEGHQLVKSATEKKITNF
jgi:hypothetical protein